MNEPKFTSKRYGSDCTKSRDLVVCVSVGGVGGWVGGCVSVWVGGVGGVCMCKGVGVSFVKSPGPG